MKFLTVFLAIFLFAGFALADDPGDRDSLIIETVHTELGDSIIDVRIFATCDDSVIYYNLPLTWNSINNTSICPTSVTYHNTINLWAFLEDSLLHDQTLIRMVGWVGDFAPYLITNNSRMHCWTIQFAVDSLNLPQIVTIDTTFDPHYYSLLFGLAGGIYSLTPVFTPGAIFYGITSDASGGPILPEKLALLHNFPNPFNSSTNIEYELTAAEYVSLEIYDLLGRKIETLFNEHQQPGRHQVIWDASGYPSGIYFYRIEAGKFIETRRMLLLK